MKHKQRIIAIILSLIMLFSNIPAYAEFLYKSNIPYYCKYY